VQVEFRARFLDRIPKLVGIAGGLAQVDLVSDLGRESGTRNHDIETGNGGIHAAVIGHLFDGRSDQLGHQAFCLRTLDLNRANVDFVDFDIELAVSIQSLQPSPNVRIGNGEPELVISDTQQYRVVDDAAMLVAQDDVPALAGFQLGMDIACNDHVHKVGRIGPFDLDLPLDGDVPHGHMLGDVLIFLEQTAFFERHVGPRMIDPVVDRVAPAALGVGQMPVGRFANAGRDQDIRVAVARLAQINRHAPTFQVWQIDRKFFALVRYERGVNGRCLGHGYVSNWLIKRSICFERSSRLAGILKNHINLGLRLPARDTNLF